MKKGMMKVMFCLVFGGATLWLIPSIGLTECTVTMGRNPYPTIQAAIDAAEPNGEPDGRTYHNIFIYGECKAEDLGGAPLRNLVVSKNFINLVGVWDDDHTTRATIIGNGNESPTIMIMGRNIVIGDLNIVGGQDGIQVYRGGTAIIRNNVIQNTERYGIVVGGNSYAYIVGNTIQDNPKDGIVVADSAFAHIGFKTTMEEWASPNTIQRNAYGVTVARSSSAQIVGNNIISNSYDGVRVVMVSQADISNNIIDGNGGNGIFVAQNSGVNLGRDTGGTIFDLPNSSNTGNGDYGLSCSIGGYADGRLGTLKGGRRKAVTDFTKDCIDSLKR